MRRTGAHSRESPVPSKKRPVRLLPSFNRRDSWHVPPGHLRTLIDQGVVSATSFIAAVIVGRSCSRADFAFFTLALGVLYGFLNVQIALVTAPLTVHTARVKQSSLPTYQNSTLVHQLVLSFMATALLIVVALLLSDHDASVAELLWVLAIVLPFIAFREYIRQVCFASVQPNRALVFDGTVGLLQSSMLIALSWHQLLTFDRAMLAMAAASLIPSCFWVRRQRHTFTLDPHEVLRDAQASWHFGRWILAAVPVNMVGTQLYPWLLTALRGPSETGMLAAALGVTSFCNPLLIGLQNVAGPAAAHLHVTAGVKALRTLVTELLLLATSGATVLIALMLWFGNHAVRLLYGDKYADADLLVGLVTAAVLPTALTSVVTHGLRALTLTSVGFTAQVLRCAVAVTLGSWLVCTRGAEGAAWGILIANITATTYEVAAFFRAVQR